jgi:uncharacterized caspase-like protein
MSDVALMNKTFLKPTLLTLLIKLSFLWVLTINVALAADNSTKFAPIKRVALVIGNGRYNIGSLKNPENDAQATRNALKGLGFEVDFYTNLDQKGMIQHIFDFFHHKASKSELRLIYFAGHGVQFEGHNYLIPTDANLGLPSEIPHTGFMLDELRRSLDGLQQGASIVILDTCRVTLCAIGQCRGLMSSLGLSNERKSSGTLIAYSTGPGQLASDGMQNEHSLYTQVLLENISTPGLPVEKLFRKLTEEVFQRSGGLQKPEFVDGLMGDEICFKADPLGRCPSF